MVEYTEYGYLTVTVSTAGGALPVEGALITIKGAEEENSDVIENVISDRGGICPPVRLPAPPKINSSIPGGGKTSARYNIETDKDGFYSVRNLFVPVYAGINSVQPVILIPVALGDDVNLYPNDTIRFNESEAPNL